MSTITLIILIPLVAALLLAVVPRSFQVVMRGVALLATLITALLALKAFIVFNRAPLGASGFRFEQQIHWVRSLGISYHVGLDGLNFDLNPALNVAAPS